MVRVGWERRRPSIPAKLREAEADAVAKPPEVKSAVVRSAFVAISSRFPSEVSLQDLQVFVRAHGLGISRETLREMVGKASAKRQNWRARGRDLPLRVTRDTLWVEDVMWALRVRKTRREFDKWEVNEHRDEWVSILEAATPSNPTVFAPPPDHRIVPPLSYTELIQDSAPSSSSAFVANPCSNASVSAGRGGRHSISHSHGGNNGRSGGSSRSRSSSSSERRIRRGRGGGGGGGGGEGGRSGGGGGSMTSTARPASTGKMWTPLESRLPTSLLLTSRPRSAVAAGAGSVGGDLATTGRGTATVAGRSEWGGEGGVGDLTVWDFPSWVGGGGSSRANGVELRPFVTAQERALFGRKPSPAAVARSTCYAPRRRPLCSADGQRHRPESGSGDDTAELYDMERYINTSSFSLAAATDLSTTVTSYQRGPEDGRSAARAWGSVASALTFEDADSAVAAAAGAAVAGGGEDLTEEAKAAEGKADENPDSLDACNTSIRNNSSDDVPGCGGAGTTETKDDKGQATLPTNANGTPVPLSTASVLAPTQGGDHLERRPPRLSTAYPLSSSGRNTTITKKSATNNGASIVYPTETSAGAAPQGLDPIFAATSGEETLRRTCGTAAAVAATATSGKGDGVAVSELPFPGSNAARNDPRGGEEREVEGEGEGEGAAEWWREALGPTLRRPVTRRSLVCGRDEIIGAGARSIGCARGEWEEEIVGGCERLERSGSRRGADAIVHSVESGSGGRRRASASAPICGFSTESKQRDLGKVLKRRSSIDESEGLASARVRGREADLARAQNDAGFQHLVGRNTIRKNFDQSLRDKACDTLALDLRGHGTHLIASETATTMATSTTTLGASAHVPGCRDGRNHHQLRPPRQDRCANGAGTAATGKLMRATERAWSSSRIEGGDGVGGGGCGGNVGGVGSLPLPTDAGRMSKPPPFGAVRGPSVQEARTTVVTHQAGMWGKCAQAHFGRFEERPYLHSFRPHTSHGLRAFGSSG